MKHATAAKQSSDRSDLDAGRSAKAQEKQMTNTEATKQGCGDSVSSSSAQPSRAGEQKGKTMNTAHNTTASSWLEVDIIGLRRTLERKGKAWPSLSWYKTRGTPTLPE